MDSDPFLCVVATRPAHPGAPEQRQAHFRTLSQSQPQTVTSGAAPRTGLGILMTENSLHSSAPPPPPATVHAMANMTPEQRLLVQEDLADRERQASSLAAAGMVAESVSLTRPVSGLLGGQPGQGGQNHQPLGLQAPPALGMGAPPTSNGNTEMEGINWNLLDLGTNLDDLDMDFASLFDPANEAASVSMQTQGGGWSSAAPEPQAPIQGVSSQHSMEGSS